MHQGQDASAPTRQGRRVLRARTTDYSGAWLTIVRHANGRVTVKDEAAAIGRPLAWFCKTAKALATELGNAENEAEVASSWRKHTERPAYPLGQENPTD